ncbi:MAG: Stp1/IreP family PP2C-type Ser/Thr phosphatase [Chloroflexota bacterium]
MAPLPNVTPTRQVTLNGAKTEKLEVLAFEWLPDQALLADRYRVFENFTVDRATVHHYHVQDMVGVMRCVSCQSRNELGESFCTQCGQEMVDAVLEQPICLLKESHLLTELGIEPELVEFASVAATGLRLPQMAFQLELAGNGRFYVLLNHNGTRLDSLTSLPEYAQVVGWGIALGQGLAFLHQQGFVYRELTAVSIFTEGDSAYLSDFADCQHSHDPEAAFQNVQQLVQLLGACMGEVLPEPLGQLITAVRDATTPLTATEFVSQLTALAEQIRHPTSYAHDVGAISDVGMARQLNEDSFMTLALTQNNRSVNQPIGIYVVADGMGGHEGGEIASGLVTQVMAQTAVSDLLTPATSHQELPDYANWIIQAVQQANTAVFQHAQSAQNDMGTTVVATLVVGDTAYVAHVGDSRAYLVNESGIQSITTDHSLVERYIAAGQLTPEEARHHPQANIVYRTIGEKPVVEVDMQQLTLAPDDCILLCSDGLNGMITDETIAQIVQRAASPQAACRTLIEAANLAGGDDNVTAVLVKLIPSGQ